MEHDDLFEAIFKRESVRKYLPESIGEEMMRSIRSRMDALQPLFPGIRTELRILPPEHVKGMFKVDAPHFLAIYSEGKPGYAANAGFILQQMDLYLSAKRLGTCWQGGPKPTKQAVPVQGLDYVICIAFGNPAEDPWRKSVSEFKRKPIADISSIRELDEFMEPVRLAPSGVNNQSWYYSGSAERVDAFYAKSLISDEMNRINVGIGLCHLWLAALHGGVDIRFSAETVAPAPRGFAYVASAYLKRS